MRTTVKVALALGVALLVAAEASAQQGGGRGFGFGGPGILLQNEGVQKELKMDQGQIDKAREAVTKITEKNRDEFAKLRDINDQAERRKKTQELTRTVSADTYKAVADVLKPEQVKRLKQIDLQQRGYNAFAEDEVQKSLKLTEAQIKEIDALAKAADEERNKLFQGGGGGQEAREKLTALRKQTLEKVTATLKDDQKKALKELTGEPFEVQFQRRPNR